MNSELITHPVVLLSNNAFTITSSCISILSSFILTIISLSSFSLFRLQQNILSITLESIIYLLLLRLNQGVLSLTPYSNYCFVYFFLCLLFFLYSGLLLSNFVFYFSISTISCYMSKISTVVAVSISLIYFYSIWILFKHKPYLLI